MIHIPATQVSTGPLGSVVYLLGGGLLALASIPLAGWVSDTILPPSPRTYQTSLQPQTSFCRFVKECGEPQTVDPRIQKILLRLEAMGFRQTDDLDLGVFAMTLLEAEDRYHVPHELLIGIAAVESTLNPLARSAKNARGLFQLRPDTAAFLWPEFSKTLAPGDAIRDLDPLKDLGDVRLSTLMGAYYISYLQNMFQGRMHLALASYNAGPAAVRQGLQNGKLISSTYVFRVYAMTEDFRHARVD